MNLDDWTPSDFAVMEIKLAPASQHKLPNGYWEQELAMEHMTPTSYHKSLLVEENAPLKVLSRSRGGRLLVCASQTRLYVFSLDDAKWDLVCQLPMPPLQVVRLVVTDEAPVHILALAISQPTMEIMFDSGPLEQQFVFVVPPSTVLIETCEGTVGTYSMTQDGLVWPGGLEMQALACYIQQHAQRRQHDLAAAFEQYAVLMEPADFVLAFYADPVTFPSVVSTVKLNGRPSFSADKGPRLARSPSLTEEEELHGIFALILVLRAVHHHIPLDQWSINTPTQTLFAQTKIYRIILEIRTDHSAVVGQLRRWLPFCKMLGKKTALFTHFSKLETDAPLFSLQDPMMEASKIRWMNRRAPSILLMMQAWIQNGESVHDILSTPLPHEQSFKEWADAMLNKLYDATSDASPLSTSGLNMPNEDAHGILWACRNELLQIDQVRIRMLSTLSNQGLSECKIRKVQKFFQQLGQNIVAHRRNYRTLQGLADKLDAIMMRIQGVEQDMERIFQDLDTTATAPDQVQSLKLFITDRMETVEKESRNEMQEIMEPSLQFVMQKRRQREVDHFLDAFLVFLQNQE